MSRLSRANPSEARESSSAPISADCLGVCPLAFVDAATELPHFERALPNGNGGPTGNTSPWLSAKHIRPYSAHLLSSWRAARSRVRNPAVALEAVVRVSVHVDTDEGTPRCL